MNNMFFIISSWPYCFSEMGQNMAPDEYLFLLMIRDVIPSFDLRRRDTERHSSSRWLFLQLLWQLHTKCLNIHHLLLRSRTTSTVVRFLDSPTKPVSYDVDLIIFRINRGLSVQCLPVLPYKSHVLRAIKSHSWRWFLEQGMLMMRIKLTSRGDRSRIIVVLWMLINGVKDLIAQMGTVEDVLVDGEIIVRVVLDLALNAMHQNSDYNSSLDYWKMNCRL